MSTAIRLRGMGRVVSRHSYPVEIERAARSTYGDHGRAQRQKPTTITIKAHVQSTTDHELEMLPAGDRTKGSVRFWTVEEVRTANVANGTEADVLIWQGARYKVIMIDDRTPLGDYIKAVAVKEGQ